MFLDSIPLQPLLLLIPVVVLYLYRRLRYYRFEQFKDFPQPPPSLLWGHILSMGEAMKAVGALDTQKHTGTQPTALRLNSSDPYIKSRC
jgi:hypothetical protein